jgi:hypothetical protein
MVVPAHFVFRPFGYFQMRILASCFTKVGNRQQLVTGELPRPARIRGNRFAATPADVPPESSLTGQPIPMSATNFRTDCRGTKIPQPIALQLVEQIENICLPAAVGSQRRPLAECREPWRACARTLPRDYDMVIWLDVYYWIGHFMNIRTSIIALTSEVSV